MPHSNPTPDQIQRLIAKLMGCVMTYRQDLSDAPTHRQSRTLTQCCDAEVHKRKCTKCHKPTAANWPRDRNASYELPVEDKVSFNRACHRIEHEWLKEHGSDKWNYRGSAEFESLAWLLYNGYRWNGEQFVKEVTDG